MKMTVDEFRRILAELVSRNNITAVEAAELLDLFEAGELPESALPALPDPAKDDRDQWWLLVLLLLIVGTGDRLRIPATNRMHLRDALRNSFEYNAGQLAKQLAESGDVAQWQADMEALIAEYYGGMATAGYGARLDDTALREVLQRTDEAFAFLLYFAALEGVKLALGKPLSQAYTSNRAILYGGSALTLWNIQNERSAEWGYVYRYESRDDGGTCSECAHYHGHYFLPGQGVFPGDVCLGGGRCRCERIREYDPEMYVSLGGR